MRYWNGVCWRWRGLRYRNRLCWRRWGLRHRNRVRRRRRGLRYWNRLCRRRRGLRYWNRLCRRRWGLRYWNRLCRKLIMFLRPKLSSDTVIYSEGERTLFLNPSVPDWISVKNKYVNIFNLFDGQNDTDGVFNFIRQNYPNDNTDLLIRQFERLFTQSEIFETNSRTESNRVSNTKPKYIYLTLTDECNLRCVYCYARERLPARSSSLDQWKRYVDILFGISGDDLCFTFTGGEPLLVPFIFELAKHIKEKGSRSILLTNGQSVSERNAELISENFSQVRISLDSITEDINSNLRGRNSLQKVLEAQKYLEGCKADVLFVSTVTQLNKSELAGFVNFFKGKVSFQPLFNMGEGRKCGDISINGLEYYESLKSAEVSSFLPGYKKNIHAFRKRPYKRCALAREELSVGPNGDLYPCHMLHLNEYKMGNLNNDEIENLMCGEKYRELNKINVDTLPQCGACIVRNFCGGGCRARVNLREEGIIGNDLFCDFEKRSILDALLYSFG